MSEFVADEHYTQRMELCDRDLPGTEVKFRTIHWHNSPVSGSVKPVGLVTSIFCLDHGHMSFQVGITPQQCRDLAVRLLQHADEVEIHQLQVKPLAVAA